MYWLLYGHVTYIKPLVGEELASYASGTGKEY